MVFRHFPQIMAGWVRIGDFHWTPIPANPGGVGPSRQFALGRFSDLYINPVARKKFFRPTGSMYKSKHVFGLYIDPVGRKKFFRPTGFPAPPDLLNHPPAAAHPHLLGRLSVVSWGVQGGSTGTAVCG